MEGKVFLKGQGKGFEIYPREDGEPLKALSRGMKRTKSVSFAKIYLVLRETMGLELLTKLL